jgi:hypothetical protein
VKGIFGTPALTFARTSFALFMLPLLLGSANLEAEVAASAASADCASTSLGGGAAAASCEEREDIAPAPVVAAGVVGRSMFDIA